MYVEICTFYGFWQRYRPFYLFIYFYFTILYWFCHTLPWINHGYTRVPILNPFPPPSPSHPSRSSQCTSPEHPVSCIEPGLVIYFTYSSIHVSDSLRSSHPCPHPQSPKDCSVHLCLFCYLTHRVIVTIFLNFIYIYTCVCVCVC